MQDGGLLLFFLAGQPHQPLLEEVLGPVLVVGAVYFAEVFGAGVGVVELEDLGCGDY